MDNSLAASDCQLTVALGHLKEALKLLDAVSAPAHIGAHVDLAIHQLQYVVGRTPVRLAEPPDQIDTKAEPH